MQTEWIASCGVSLAHTIYGQHDEQPSFKWLTLSISGIPFDVKNADMRTSFSLYLDNVKKNPSIFCSYFSAIEHFPFQMDKFILFFFRSCIVDPALSLIHMFTTVLLIE